jgi:aspartate-semialdehyde dehydrogenase
VIDSSGLFALEPDVPLVVPDVNPFVLADYRNRNVIAVPNSLTSQLLSALKPLIDDGGLSRITVTNIISASAHGKKAVDALAGQSAKLLNGIPIDEDDFFGRQLAFNMLPLLPDREGSVREERRIVDEVRKIMQDDGLLISASIVQSPVFYGHAQMVNFEACARWRRKKHVMRFHAVKMWCCRKRPTSRPRLAMRRVRRTFLLAACITITVCRSKFSSGLWQTTYALAAR